MRGFFTVCNRHQLPGAIALGESIRRLHPDSRFVIGLADDIPNLVLPAGIELLPISTLQIPRLSEMSGRYLDYEFVQAVRPWFGKYLLEHSPNRFCWVFMAPSVMVFSALNFLEEFESDFLLTPNITGPLPQAGNVDDKRILNIGMFNANAWVARATPEIKDFFDWWRTRTIDRAFFDLCNGMCMDQLWLNYAPVLTKQRTIFRKPNWHVGLHNLLRIPLEFDNNGSPLADGKPLITFDFAGITSFHPVWSDHKQVLGTSESAGKLLSDYKNLLPPSKKEWTEGAVYGRRSTDLPFRDFRRTIKSELNHIADLIDKIDI